MSAGWGALIGAGAAVLFAPFTGGASLGLLPKFLLLGAAGAALGAGTGAVAKTVLSKFGDTPKNELKELGIDPNKLHEESIKHRQDRIGFLEEKNKEGQKKVDDLDKKIASLDETIKNSQLEISKMPDNDPHKAVKIAQMNGLIDQKNGLQKERDNEQKKIDGRNEKIDRVFQSLGDPVKYNSTQYNEKANALNLGSWKNWGIGLFFLLIFFMILGFVKKIFGTLSKTIKG